MNLSADTGIVESLNYISQQLNRYLSPTIFIFGVTGNILNCLVLSQRTLRSNPCALLFLLSSFVDLISILIGLPTRILAGWNLDPTTTISLICRLRAFIVFSTRTMAIWLIMLATVDRWLLSSVDVRRRQMSSLRNVKIQIMISFVLSILSYVHMFYCYDANQHDQPLRCYGKTDGCRLVTDLIYALITIMIPLIIMVIFGVMTILNVHHVHMRVQHRITISNNKSHSGHMNAHAKRMNYHLLRMLLVQVILLIVLCIPQSIQKFYVTLRPFGRGSEVEDALKIFAYNIELLLAYIASGMPFYIYTLTGGTVFRKELMHMIQAVTKRMTCKFNNAIN